MENLQNFTANTTPNPQPALSFPHTELPKELPPAEHLLSYGEHLVKQAESLLYDKTPALDVSTPAPAQVSPQAPTWQATPTLPNQPQPTPQGSAVATVNTNPVYSEQRAYPTPSAAVGSDSFADSAPVETVREDIYATSTPDFKETYQAPLTEVEETNPIPEASQPTINIYDTNPEELSKPVGTYVDEPQKVELTGDSIQEIEVSNIVANPYQPRKVFDEDGLQELASSIKEHGIIQPIVVTEKPNGYEIVVGERRFRASVLAGLTKVPAIVKRELTDQTKLEVALIENIQRRELNPIEEALAYDRMMKNLSMTQDQVAKKVGKSRSAVANTVRLLNLPAEIQRALVEQKISEGHARAILGLIDPSKQLSMFKMVLENSLNVRQVESKVREIMVKKQLDTIAPDPELIALETELRGQLGAQVRISRQGKGGKITIEFFSDQELSEIIQKMSEHTSPEQNNSFLTV